MSVPNIIKPSQGSRIYKDASGTILFGQPPEVLKGLLLKGIGSFDTLVLSDVREKDGSLMNSLEFPLYSFLFFSSGLAQDRRLNLVGDATAISQALRLLRITLIGPTRKELEEWKSVAGQAEEWLAVCDHLALKDKSGAIIQVEEFFNIIPFENETAVVGERTIKRQQPDVYEVINHSGNALIDLARDKKFILTMRSSLIMFQVDWLKWVLKSWAVLRASHLQNPALDLHCATTANIY